MRSRHYPVIARQGLWLLLPLVGAALYVVSFYGGLFSIPVWLAAALIAFLFRDPPRHIPAKPLGLVAPVDGCIASVQEEHDPWLKREACCLRLKGSITGSYAVRSPMEGKLVKQWYAVPNGDTVSRFVLATWIQSDEGDDIVLVVYPRVAWLRLRSDIVAGERTGQGMRFCFSPFGAEVEVWMPANTHIEVAPEKRVQAGSDIIGILNHGS